MFQPFGLDKALKALQDGQALTGKDGLLAYTNKLIPIDAGFRWISSDFYRHQKAHKPGRDAGFPYFNGLIW
ncbi:hypothetical protein [Rouxiella aceris]|uniref:hypothetical protein n=1 Tax=Rouxiella aceris TaxID=2703884 RepID=UPI00146E4531|nr:hypothetical protein [Rouxiella aceris]